MEHVRFGGTGLLVSRLCLGTMTFGYQCDEEASVSILDAAADGGVTFIDTADVYPLGAPRDHFGRTEEILGRWLKGRRDHFIVATKGNATTGVRPWQGGNSRQHLTFALEQSLRRLQTDHVELYQLHADDPSTPLDETMAALDDFVRAGKVRYIGCSNFLAYRLARALGRSDALGVARFSSAQPRYNMLFRQNERELFPLCAEEQVAVIPYNPLAGGFLTGKHQPGPPPDGGRFTLGGAGAVYQDRYWHERMFAVVEQVRTIANDAGVSMATLAIQWTMANPVVTAPILGASKPGQLADAFAALDAPIDADAKAALDELTHEFRFGDSVR